MKTQDFKFGFFFEEARSKHLCSVSWPLEVSRSRNQIVEPQIPQKTNKQIWFSILNSSQNRKTNSFVWFLGESVAQKFCFEIFWPLVSTQQIIWLWQSSFIHLVCADLGYLNFGLHKIFHRKIFVNKNIFVFDNSKMCGEFKHCTYRRWKRERFS